MDRGGVGRYDLGAGQTASRFVPAPLGELERAQHHAGETGERGHIACIALEAPCPLVETPPPAGHPVGQQLDALTAPHHKTRTDTYRQVEPVGEEFVREGEVAAPYRAFGGVAQAARDMAAGGLVLARSRELTGDTFGVWFAAVKAGSDPVDVRRELGGLVAGPLGGEQGPTEPAEVLGQCGARPGRHAEGGHRARRQLRPGGQLLDGQPQFVPTLQTPAGLGVLEEPEVEPYLAAQARGQLHIVDQLPQYAHRAVGAQPVHRAAGQQQHQPTTRRLRQLGHAHGAGEQRDGRFHVAGRHLLLRRLPHRP